MIGCKSKPIDFTPILPTQDYSQNIKDSADKIDLVTSEQPDVLIHTDNIRHNANKIDKDVKTYQESIKNLNKQNIDLKNESTKSYKKTLMLFIMVSGLSVGISIMLFFLGKLQSLVITAIAFAVLISSITLLNILEYFLYISIGSVIVVAGLVGYGIYKSRVSNKANEELVKVIAKAVEDGALNHTELTDIANSIQSNSTKKVVDYFQDKLSLRNKETK